MELDGRLTYECSCKAGEHGQVCWHAALIAALPGECSRRRAYRAQQQHTFSPEHDLPPSLQAARTGLR